MRTASRPSVRVSHRRVDELFKQTCRAAMSGRRAQSRVRSASSADGRRGLVAVFEATSAAHCHPGGRAGRSARRAGLVGLTSSWQYA